MALALTFSGCTVATRVSLSEPSAGRGTVTVSVSLDRSALAAFGGLAALRSDMATADLAAAGWTLTGPAATPDGGAVVSAHHPFTNQADVGPLLSQVAGPGVFRVSLRRHHTFWHTEYQLDGRVDLSCGLGCFGDLALGAATGSPVGVDPGALSAAAGQPPSSVFKFSLDARLPGRLQSTDASSRQDGTVGWTPALGRTLTLAARSSAVNEGAVAAVAGAGAALLLAVVGVGVLLLVRRRRRRGSGSGSEPAAKTVTPAS